MSACYENENITPCGAQYICMEKSEPTEIITTNKS
jgi:hypothetical protein